MRINKGQKKIITLDLDLNDILTGFDSAQRATQAHHQIVKHYASPLLLGPPPSDVLLELVMHMFTENEADLVQYLPPWRPRTAAKVAKLSGRSASEVQKVLDSLSFTKFVILAFGSPRKYTILPIVPGTFEMALMTKDVTTRNTWHKKFAELFEHLWDKGYLIEYITKGRPAIRYLPVMKVSKTLHMAWPSDKLEEVLKPYRDFAVGNCQCRLAMQLVGKGCDRPMKNCVVLGPMSKHFIERGLMRKTDRREIMEIKRNAEEHGLVSWMMNEVGGQPLGNGSCSCCGCCCHALRMLTQFNVPGALSKPHFLPKQNNEKCTLCQKCIKACPMGALTISGRRLLFNKIRCIGCGLCVVACKFGALTLEPAKEVTPHQASWLEAFLNSAPAYMANSLRIWVKRLLS